MENILVSLKKKAKIFTPVEKKIADYILKYPNETMKMSVQKLALNSGVSPAGIIRMSKLLGYKGFTELKLDLSATLSNNQSQELVREIEEEESVSSIKRKLFARISYMGTQTNELLKEELVKESVLKIERAQALFVYGIGASSLVAQDIMHKFTRVGKMVFFSQDSHVLLTSLVSFRGDALLILISNSGEQDDVIRLLKEVNSLDVQVMALTGNKKSTLATMADLVLPTESGESIELRAAATISLMAQLYTVDIMFYAYATKHYNEISDDIRQSSEAIKNSLNIDN